MANHYRPDSYRMNTSRTKAEEYSPYSFSREMQRLDDLQKQLDDVKQCLDKLSMGSLLLNAQMVSMFDPIRTDTLESVLLECLFCRERVQERLEQATEELHARQ